MGLQPLCLRLRIRINQINTMEANEAKRKLCEIRSNLTDDEQKQAIWIAIRAIDTCTENGFVVEE